MAWDSKYEKYGIVKIEGDKVKVYKDQVTYTTVFVNKLVTNAAWDGGALIVRTKNGKMRRYISPHVFPAI